MLNISCVAAWTQGPCSAESETCHTLQDVCMFIKNCNDRDLITVNISPADQSELDMRELGLLMRYADQWFDIGITIQVNDYLMMTCENKGLI